MLIDLSLEEVLVIRDALNRQKISEERARAKVSARDKMEDVLVELFDK